MAGLGVGRFSMMVGTTNRRECAGGGRKALLLALLGLAALARPASAAVFVVENFGADPSWVDRDGGEMSVGWNNSFGYLVNNGSMQGAFGSQDVFSPETDAMRINSGSSLGAFSGDYYGSYVGFSPTTASLSFRFLSDSVLPSDLRIRIGDGSFLFSRSLTAQASAFSTWQNITVNLDYAGWLGGSGLEYSNVFSAVSFIDIQITRNGLEEQNFFVDDFTLSYLLEEEGGGDPSSAIPEPATTQILLLGMICLAGPIKRFMRAKAKAEPKD